MIRIRHIEIQNYRSCFKTSIDLDTNLTTLIGRNGAGKTNILKGIELLTKLKNNQYYTAKKLKEEFFHSIIKLNINISNIECILKTDIYYKRDNENDERIYAFKSTIKNVNTNEIVAINQDFFEYYADTFNIEDFKPLKKVSFNDSTFIAYVITYLSEIRYYSASQFLDPLQCPPFIEIENKRNVRSSKISRGHDKFLRDLYYNHKSSPKLFNRYLDTVNKKGVGLIDGIIFNEQKIPSKTYQIKSDNQVKTIDRNTTIIFPTVSINKNYLNFNQLSEGTLKTLALIFYILNEECELLLIEEPEICVHHGLLKDIIELINIQSKHKQIIISTHSDFVLNLLNPENVVLVTHDENRGATTKTVAKALSKNDYTALKTYLNDSGGLGDYWKEGGLESE